MKQKSVALTDRHWTAISAEAKRLGIALSDALRRMLDELLDRREKQVD